MQSVHTVRGKVLKIQPRAGQSVSRVGRYIPVLGQRLGAPQALNWDTLEMRSSGRNDWVLSSFDRMMDPGDVVGSPPASCGLPLPANVLPTSASSVKGTIRNRAQTQLHWNRMDAKLYSSKSLQMVYWLSFCICIALLENVCWCVTSTFMIQDILWQKSKDNN